MVIEDLIKDRRIGLINLAYGAPKSDYRSTNVAHDYVSYWLIPKTWKSCLFQVCYRAFRRGVALFKHGISTLDPERAGSTSRMISAQDPHEEEPSCANE
jgi:hypothetical protein